jgi:hypothetical protein
MQERCLREEVLLMAVNSSSRNLGRADAASIVEDVCGDHDRLRYEIYF